MEWQFVSARARPRPTKEYFIIYTEEGLLPQAPQRMTVVASNREAVRSWLLGAPFP